VSEALRSARLGESCGGMCGSRARAVKLGARMYGHDSAGYAHVAAGGCTSVSVVAVAASPVLAAASRASRSAPLDSLPPPRRCVPIVLLRWIV